MYTIKYPPLEGDTQNILQLLIKRGRILLLLFFTFHFSLFTSAQTIGNMSQKDYDVILQMNIGKGNGSTAVNRTNRAAYLEIGDSTNSTKALLLPRGDTTDVTFPIIGLLFYNLADSTIYQYNGITWTGLGSGSGGGSTLDDVLHAGNTSDQSILLTAAGSGDIGIQAINGDGSGVILGTLDDVGYISLSTPTSAGLIYAPVSGSRTYQLPSASGTIALTSDLTGRFGVSGEDATATQNRDFNLNGSGRYWQIKTTAADNYFGLFDNSSGTYLSHEYTFTNASNGRSAYGNISPGDNQQFVSGAFGSVNYELLATATPSLTLTASGLATGQLSRIILYPDSIALYPGGRGKIFVDSLRDGTSDDEIMTWNAGMVRKVTGVKYNFTGLANWDKLRYNSSTSEWVNYTDLGSGGADSSFYLKEYPSLSYLDVTPYNAAIIEGRLWIKTHDSTWRRQAYDTTYIILPAEDLILDTYTGAASALSLRKLSDAYLGSAIRVRRSSDNAEQDIGFVSNYLDTASLKTFVGANDGRIVTWYDQSGNSIDGSQSTGANQPYILTSGVFTYANGYPSVNFGDHSAAYYLVVPTGFLNGSTALSYFQVAKIANTAGNNAGIFSPTGTNSTGLEVLQSGVSGNYSFLRINGTGRGAASPPNNLWQDDIQSLTSIFGNATSVAVFNNSASVTLGSAAAMPALNYNGVYAIGRYNGNLYMNGNIQELIIYTTNQTSNRTGIETNINTFYTIY